MIRTLLIITGASVVLAAAAGAGAAALGGNDLARNGWTWTFREDSEDHTVRFQRGDDGPPVTREIAWTGGDRLVVDISGDVVYMQGDQASVVVTGPQGRVERIRLVDGRLTDEGADGAENVVIGWNNRDSRLRVVVTAPAVKTFDLRTSADLSIRGYDQPSLQLNVSGSGDVDVGGRAASATVDVSGSGEADLSALQLTDVVIDVSGSGDVWAGPTGSAAIDISGSGDVELTRRPARLTQDISGSGDLDQR